MREILPAQENTDRLPDVLGPGVGYTPLLVCGDSHIVFYTSRAFADQGPWLPVPFLCMGASVRGLPKPVSRLNYGSRILATLQRCRAAMRASGGALLLHFGQNDVEFVYHFKRAANEETGFSRTAFDAFVTSTLDRYEAFLEQVQALLGADIPVIVCGIFPPTLSDDHLFKNETTSGDVAWATDVENFEVLRVGLSRLEMPDWAARTELHRAFNRGLRSRCETRRLPFLDVFDLLLGDGGAVAPAFIRIHGGSDHHLDINSFETQLAGQEAGARLRRMIPPVP